MELYLSRELGCSGYYYFTMSNTDTWLETVLLLFLMTLRQGWTQLTGPSAGPVGLPSLLISGFSAGHC